MLRRQPVDRCRLSQRAPPLDALAEQRTRCACHLLAWRFVGRHVPLSFPGFWSWPPDPSLVRSRIARQQVGTDGHRYRQGTPKIVVQHWRRHPIVRPRFPRARCLRDGPTDHDWVAYRPASAFSTRTTFQPHGRWKTIWTRTSVGRSLEIRLRAVSSVGAVMTRAPLSCPYRVMR